MHMPLTVLVLIFCFSKTVEPACSPVREGESTTLSCNAITIECLLEHNIILIWTAGSRRVARCSRNLGCYGVDSSISVTFNRVMSTLTINSVSRTDPFDMEVMWTCRSCHGYSRTVCNKLEVYALAENPTCTVSEDTESGDIKSVTISCSTSKVYPRARCRFYSRLDGDNPVEITTNPLYNHTETGETPIYYMSQCSVTVSVKELGEGTHSFTGYIYPDVTDGLSKVNGTPADKSVTLKPPPAPPQMTVGSESFQGVNSANIVTVTEGYSGDVTCRVEGGYPAAHTTQLKCGQQVTTGAGQTAALSFTAEPLTREMNGAVCTCTSQHDIGSYSNNETKVMFNILYAPQVTFTVDPAQATFSKGDNLEFKCSGQGNPEPTLTLTKTETNKDLIIVQTTELTHTLTLSCTDTGVYACSGQNSQGTTEQEISIGVSCRQQLSPLFYLTHKVDPAIEAIIGETAHIDLEIYGYPEPTALTLQRLYDDTDLTSSPRHSVTYTASAAPFGAVNVTISDLVEADLTIYILTVDNGVGEALKYIFHLNQVDANEDALNIAAIVIAVIAVVIIAGLVVVIIFLLKKIRGPKDRLNSKCSDPRESDPQKKQNDDQLIPLEMPTTKDTTPVSASHPPRSRQYENIHNIPATTDTTPASASLPPRSRQYENIHNIPATTDTTPVSASLPPRSRQYENIHNIPATTDTTPVSASLPPRSREYETMDDMPATANIKSVLASYPTETAQYETIQYMTSTSGTYNSTSPQNVEAPNFYMDLEPNHATIGNYSNVSN